MKRMIAFIFVLVLFLPILVLKINYRVCDEFDFSRIVIVSKSGELIDGCPVIKNGDTFYYELKKDTLNKLNKKDYNQVDGVVYYLDDGFDLDKFNKYLNYTLYGGYKIENSELFYGFDKNYDDFVILGNKKVNVQVVHCENQWIIGYPLILTGF